jgi:hypothetical protein
VAATRVEPAVSLNDDDGTVYLYVADAADEPSFGAATIIGEDIVTDFRDFPKPTFLSDGSLVVAWHGYPASGARIFLSRESNGFQAEEASGGAPGVPCECCPLEAVVNGAGDLLANASPPGARAPHLASAVVAASERDEDQRGHDPALLRPLRLPHRAASAARVEPARRRGSCRPLPRVACRGPTRRLGSATL